MPEADGEAAAGGASESVGLPNWMGAAPEVDSSFFSVEAAGAEGVSAEAGSGVEEVAAANPLVVGAEVAEPDERALMTEAIFASARHEQKPEVQPQYPD